MEDNLKDTSRASDFHTIPSELGQFIQNDAYSLVIRGKAGTGKTALALTILNLLRSNQNRLYISTRLATSELFEYYPWIHSFSSVEKQSKGKRNLSGEAPSLFVDARLDEPSTLFERITNELMDTGSPLIIVDTWDAVGDFMDREALNMNAKILQIWRQRSHARMIFVIEKSSEKAFDNLVDGIVELEEEYVESRKVRKIHISKLRGLQISRPWSFFTLNHGRFRSFQPFDPSLVEDEESSKENNHNPNRRPLALDHTFEARTGLNKLDDALAGRFSRQSLVNLELNTGLNPKIALILVSRMIATYAEKKNPVVILPPLGIRDQYIRRFLENLIPDRTRRELVYLVNSNANNSSEGTLFSSLKAGAIKKSVLKSRRRNPTANVLCVLSLPPFESNISTNQESLLELIGSHCDQSVLITHGGQKITELISALSDTKLKIKEMSGTFFLQPEKPWASFYVLVNDTRSRKIALEPIV